MVAGRMFQPGKREMIVGVGAQAMYQHMQIGDKVILPDGEWPIVGVFTTGDLLDGQLLGDTETLMTATAQDHLQHRAGAADVAMIRSTPSRRRSPPIRPCR